MLQDNWPLVLLGLRIGVAAALYLFVLVCIRALRAEVRARTMPYAIAVPTRGVATPSAPAPTARVEVVPRDAPARVGDHLEVLAYTGEGGGPGRLAGRSYALRGPALIGRSAGSTIVLPERQVSSRHARVFPDGGAWWVEDLGSTNGTYIGSRRVSGRERLDPSTEVRFGPVVARLVRDTARTGAR